MKHTMRIWLALVLALCAGTTASAFDLTTGTLTNCTIAFSGDGVTAGTPPTATAATAVTITVTPSEGYATKDVTVKAFMNTGDMLTRANTIIEDIEVTPVEGDANAFTFTMPAAHIVVDATTTRVIQADWITVTDPTYTGSPLTPDVTVKDGETTLTLDTDYTVTYSNNTVAALSTAENAPTVTISAVEGGAYSDPATKASKKFNINKAAATISYATTEVSKTFGDAAFTNALTHTPAEGTDGNGIGTVTYAVTAETKDADCTSDHVATINATTGEVTITGTGTATITATVTDGANYTYSGMTGYSQNKASVTYTLTVSKGTIVASALGGSYVYSYDSNHAITVSVTTPSTGYTVMYGTAEDSYDLTASPSYNTVGAHTTYYKVSAPNYADFTGSATVTISKADLSAAVVALDPTSFEYDGTAKKPTVKLVTLNDKRLYTDTDFTVSYSDNTNAGTAKATITGKGNYKGTASQTFTIKKAQLSITADAKTKVAGEKDPELTYKAEGLVGEDKLTGALTRAEGENVGEYDITQGDLSAGDNYAIKFTGAKLTITAKPEPTPTPTPPETTYKVVVAKTTGGEVVVSKVNDVKANEQVNMIVTPDEGYHLESLTVTTDKGANVTVRDTKDAKGNEYKAFNMPAANAIVTAIFAQDVEEGEGEQNIFIIKAKYGEVISHVLHADEGQQVNLEVRPVKGYEDSVLDDLYVINDKGKRLTINTIETKEEGLVYYFIMKGEKAFVYNTFKGTNNTVDESQPVEPDNELYLVNSDYLSLLNLGNGAEGVQLAMTLVANILATFNDNGELNVKQGEDDIIMALLNLKSGWQIQIDFTGMIKTLAPDVLEGVGADGILSSSEVYTLHADTNLELLLQSSVLPLVIKSISIIAPEPEPTAISGFRADEKAADIYDLRGRKADPNHLRPGIYIKNGNKVVIK